MDHKSGPCVDLGGVHRMFRPRGELRPRAAAAHTALGQPSGATTVPPTVSTSGKMTEFSELGLSPATLKAVADTGYTTPPPIQAEAIPLALHGQHVLAIA